jgi:tRNA(Arg) A34 adenosine deaminase TadA
MHGEITAIRHCTDILRQRGWSPQRILQSWKDFSLYTNGEPCPMCASAIRWAGFKEVIYGSSIRTIAESTPVQTWPYWKALTSQMVEIRSTFHLL